MWQQNAKCLGKIENKRHNLFLGEFNAKIENDDSSYEHVVGQESGIKMKKWLHSAGMVRGGSLFLFTHKHKASGGGH